MSDKTTAKKPQTFPNIVQLQVLRLAKVADLLHKVGTAAEGWAKGDPTNKEATFVVEQVKLIDAEIPATAAAIDKLVKAGWKPSRSNGHGFTAGASVKIRPAYKTEFTEIFGDEKLKELFVEKVSTKGRVLVRVGQGPDTLGFVPKNCLEVA